jgi:hypothetical protein
VATAFVEALIVSIQPEPSPAERVAILMALEQVLSQAASGEVARLPPWAAAGRREARRGIERGAGSGWGRGRDRLSGW